MNKKTKKVVIRLSLLFAAAAVLCLLLIVLTRPVLIKLNGEKEVRICYGEE